MAAFFSSMVDEARWFRESLAKRIAAGEVFPALPQDGKLQFDFSEKKGATLAYDLEKNGNISIRKGRG